MLTHYSVNLLADLLVTALKLYKDERVLLPSVLEQQRPPQPGGAGDFSRLVADIASRAADAILKPILIQQRNSLGQVD